MRERKGPMKYAECHPDREHWARGLCANCYSRIRRNPTGRKRGNSVTSREKFVARFWARTRLLPSGCLLWLGRRNQWGYGMVAYNHTRYVAHRMAYELHVGPVPDGLELDHLCRNPSCVNPLHLEPVTHSENMKRAKQAEGA